MAESVPVAKVGELAAGEMKLVEAGDRAIVLLNVEGELYALDNECTHAGCDLADGDLEGNILECPCHGSRFNVVTGAVENPPAVEPVPTYPVRIEGDDVLVGPA
ncbi:MAG: non-heme iron oxygenase ferredoxin subunit [Chloroflexi bacterium]|nr:non-heme iron oxygenase ferredoxin subunit [Chloroflexota bacterium]